MLVISFFAVEEQIKNNKQNLVALETSIRDDYDENIKNQVESVISLLDTIYLKYEKSLY